MLDNQIKGAQKNVKKTNKADSINNYDDSYNHSEILSRINTWISNCDSKISFALVFAGALLGFFFTSNIIHDSLFQVVNNVLILTKKELLSLIAIIILVFFSISLLLSIWYLFKGLKGKINIENYKQYGLEEESLLFFGTIKSMKYKDFKDKVKNIEEDDLKNDYLSQIHVNSIICNQKFINYNKGLKFLLFSVILFVLLNFIFLFF